MPYWYVASPGNLNTSGARREEADEERCLLGRVAGRQKQPSSGNPCDNLLDGDGAPGIIGRGRVGPQWAGKFEWLTLKRSHGGALTNGSRYWALHMPYLPSWQTTPCMLAMISSGVGVQDKSNVGDAATRESWLRHPICEESSGYIV